MSDGVQDTPTITANGAAATVNDIRDEISQTVIEKGFRQDWDLAQWLEDRLDAEPMANSWDLTSDDLAKFRLIVEALRLNFIGMKLMLTVSELAEALSELRLYGAEGLLDREDDGKFGTELADTHIRLFDLEQMLNVSSGDEILAKMAKNKRRPFMHGKKA